jgi:hypothetical protein
MEPTVADLGGRDPEDKRQGEKPDSTDGTGAAPLSPRFLARGTRRSGNRSSRGGALWK